MRCAIAHPQEPAQDSNLFFRTASFKAVSCMLHKEASWNLILWCIVASDACRREESLLVDYLAYNGLP